MILSKSNLTTRNMELRTRKRIMDALDERQWMSKLYYILRVMDSCERSIQLAKAFCWGSDLLDKELKLIATKTRLSYQDLCTFTKVYRNKLWDFWKEKCTLTSMNDYAKLCEGSRSLLRE